MIIGSTISRHIDETACLMQYSALYPGDERKYAFKYHSIATTEIYLFVLVLMKYHIILIVKTVEGICLLKNRFQYSQFLIHMALSLSSRPYESHKKSYMNIQ